MLDALKVLFILTGASTYLVTKYIRIGIGDKNETLVYNMSSIDLNNNETKILVNKNSQLSLTTMSSKEREEFTRRRYGLTKQSTSGDVFLSNNKSSSKLDDFIKEYKYRVIKSNENSSHTRFHFSDDQNIASQNRPVFEIEIMEEDDRYLPKRLLQVTVSDEKYQIKDIHYSVSGHGVDLQNLSKSKFGINSTSGEVYALRALDRDLPFGRPQWKLSVFAEDAKTRQLVGYADVIVNLKDINDNSPFFPHKNYFANVTENGTIGQFVTKLTAIDVDDPFDGSNAKITYNIEDNQVNDNGELIFAIDSQTGIITTDVCCLDRELHSQYKIKVIASDGDGLKASATVTITVIDVNDMPPKFSKNEWFVEIDEMDNKNNSEESLIPQMPILIVTVTDSDLFQTNEFVFKILNNNNINSEYFSLTANSDASASLRVIKPLDYENVSQRNINLTVGVSDNGSNFSDTYHTDYCLIHIRLRDINDNEPQFVKSNIDVSVAEDTKLGSIITKFHATDADQSGVSTVSYKILRESDKRRHFSIDSNGIVRLERSLDREKLSKHKLSILATDDGNPPKSSTATLTVTVDDINDNAPNLLNNYLPVILENSPPQKIGEIFATDLDDRTKGNGPPFTFKLDSTASDVIRDSFKVQYDHSGDGKAIVYSRTTFDREVEKEYLLPIVIKDSGFPAQTSTNTLTVVIGDINDNRMRDGWKKITVFYIQNNQKQSDTQNSALKLTSIGRINVDDDDDWDLNDKIFYWFNDNPNPNFEMDSKTGMISMKNMSKGDYELKFTVFDRTHKQEVHSKVWIQVNEIEYEWVFDSGSIRISGITSDQLISIWSWRTKRQIKSFYEKLKDSLKRLIRCDQIEIFSVIQKQERPPIVDVRYYATRKQSLLSSFFLNALIEQNKAILENELQLNITQIGINECMQEDREECESESCTTDLHLNESNPVLINSNYSSFVGINLVSKANCICKYSQLSTQPFKTCINTKCLNGGTCIIASDKSLCKCPQGFDGPYCELRTRSFNGQGWVWLEPLPQCSESHISLEILTQMPNGLILYYGPMNRPSFGASEIITDFISLELKNGMSRMLCDFGSGTQELIVNSPKPLNDGEWHTIDIFFDTQTVRLMIDKCIDAVTYDSEPLKMDRSRCENITNSPFFSELLNVNAPLQIGGVSHQPIDKYYNWSHLHSRVGFTGCIQNLIHNTILYDFGSVYNSANSLQGCSVGESMCNFFSKMCVNGKCYGTYNKAKCVCNPGWHGSKCEKPTQSKMFQQHSFIKYTLSFDLNPYSNHIQLLFRTRESYGDLLRLSSKDKREYCILEIREARIQFRFNLNHLRSSTEQVLRLKHILVNDGEWHLIRVERFGSTASLTLDEGGDGKRSEVHDYKGLHQLIKIERRNVVIGGDVNYIGIGAGVVGNDFDEGCLNDIRLDGRHLPMENATENASVFESQEVVDGCPSNNPCFRITCETPFVCHDIWMTHECRCPVGSIITNDGKSCKPVDDCDKDNCMKEERQCMSSAAHLCSCSDNSTVCNRNENYFTINTSTIAVSALIVCVINIPLIIAMIIICVRYKRKITIRNTKTNDNRSQIEEIIVKNDIKTVDDSSKHVRIVPNSTVIDFDKSNHHLDKSSFSEFSNAQHIEAEDLADIIRDHIEKIDLQNDEQCDNVCIYSLEGSENTVCSLSSLSSISSLQYNILYTTAGSPHGLQYINDSQ